MGNPLDPAPAGLGAGACRHRGRGVGYGDVESSWPLVGDRLDHPGLPPEPVAVRGRPGGAGSHGRHVLGLVSGREGGIAPDARIRVLSSNVPRVSGDPPAHAAALWAAIPELRPGDVLLVEAQVSQGPDTWLPVEALPDARAAVVAAVAAGIVVVAAGGNGGRDLDTAEVVAQEGRRVFDPGSADFVDTGAVLVAAARLGPAGWRREGVSTNYGRRIDCFADGWEVPTLGETTGSTSAATAIVAGAALCVQSMALAAYGAPLSPWDLRALLRRVGTDGEAGLGRMPDLVAIEREIFTRRRSRGGPS